MKNKTGENDQDIIDFPFNSNSLDVFDFENILNENVPKGFDLLNDNLNQGSKTPSEMFSFDCSEKPCNNNAYKYYSDDFINELNSCKNTNELSKADFKSQNEIEGVSNFDIENEYNQCNTSFPSLSNELLKFKETDEMNIFKALDPMSFIEESLENSSVLNAKTLFSPDVFEDSCSPFKKRKQLINNIMLESQSKNVNVHSEFHNEYLEFKNKVEPINTDLIPVNSVENSINTYCQEKDTNSTNLIPLNSSVNSNTYKFQEELFVIEVVHFGKIDFGLDLNYVKGQYNNGLRNTVIQINIPVAKMNRNDMFNAVYNSVYGHLYTKNIMSC